MTNRDTRLAQVTAWARDGTAKWLRLQAGLSAAKAAQQLEVSDRTLVRWEAAATLPIGYKIDAYHRWLQALHRKHGQPTTEQLAQLRPPAEPADTTSD